MARPCVEQEPERTRASNEDRDHNLAVLGRCKTNILAACLVGAGGPRGHNCTQDNQTDCDEVTRFHEASLIGSLEAACGLVTLGVVMVP
jgi:hypothetical protein